jgi:hypothetical protein
MTDIVDADAGRVPRSRLLRTDLSLRELTGHDTAALSAQRLTHRAAAVDDGLHLRPAQGAATWGDEGAGHADGGEKQEHRIAHERGFGWSFLRVLEEVGKRGLNLESWGLGRWLPLGWRPVAGRAPRELPMLLSQ